MTLSSKEVLSLDDLISRYEEVVKGIDATAKSDHDRAYGGVVRAGKGKLVEFMARHLVAHGWRRAGGDFERLSFDDFRSCQVHITDTYVNRLPAEIREYVLRTRNQHFYKAQVDRHVFVDGNLVMGVECKAYAENAMLKRILVDYRLLKSLFPDLLCCLLQLESMLGGQYSRPHASPQLGSPRTHTLMSFFPEVDLHIVTLLEGERKVQRPIHKVEYFKPLLMPTLDGAVSQFAKLLAPLV